MRRQVVDRLVAEMPDAGKGGGRPAPVGHAANWRIGAKAHAVENVLIVEIGEGLDVEREVEPAGRAEAPAIEHFLERVGDRRRIDIVAPERLVAPAEAIMQL